MSRRTVLGENGGMDVDITIVGGGLAGLSLAVALRNARLNVALIEGRAPVRPRSDAEWDSRIYALSPANARFLDSIGVWQHLPLERRCDVQAMEIFGDASSELHFSAYDSGVGELAWIVESSLLQNELWLSAQRQPNLTLLCPSRPNKLEIEADVARITLEDGRVINSKLVVAADGADSWTRTAAGIAVDFYPYDQLGVVANFSCQEAHRGTAYQWFREDGVLAWLPLPDNRISMVWSTGVAHAKELLALPADEMARTVAESGGEAAEPVRAPIRAEQEVPQQSVIGQGDEECHQRIDLRALGLVGKLECGEDEDGRPQANPMSPQAAAEIVGQQQRATTAQARDWIVEVPILAKLSQRKTSPKPGISLPPSWASASGVTSRPVRPVPPVTMMQSIIASSTQRCSSATISAASSFSRARSARM